MGKAKPPESSAQRTERRKNARKKADMKKLKVSAVTRVFSIAELAQAIFLELPPQEIMVNIQRVNHQFQAVVLGSTPIQQALFFKPLATEGLQFVKSLDENRGGSWREETGKGCARKVYQNSLLRYLTITTMRAPIPVSGISFPKHLN